MCISLFYLQVCVCFVGRSLPLQAGYFPGFLIFLFAAAVFQTRFSHFLLLVKQRWPLVNMMMTVVQMPEMLLLLLVVEAV